MEPLTALGAAAAAVQFVDFGTRLLSTSWEVYKDGTGREVKDFKVVLQDLRRLKKVIQQELRKHSIDPPSLDSPSSILAARDLFNYCAECDAVATQLEAVLPTTIKRMRSLKHKQITGARFRSALEQVLNRSTIKELHDDLNRIRSGTVDCMVALTWAAMREMPVAIRSIDDKLDSVMAQLQLNLEGTHSSGPVVQGYICDLSEGLSVESFLRNNDGIATMNEIRRSIFSQDLKLNELPHHPAFDSAVSDDQSLAETITSWLKFESMKSRESAIETPYEDTYDWVFSPPIVDQTGKPRWANFHHWLVSTDAEEAPKAYWITGKPGSGKSTMMKYVANHHKTKTCLETWAAGVHLDIITYYAWKPGRDDLAKSMEGLLRTIFYQLLKEHLELAPIIFPRRWQYILYCHRAGISSIIPGSWYIWELEESLQILLGLELSCLNSKLAIFIDGLDEFTAAPGAFCDLVQRLSTNAFMKICVASREWYEFEETFARSPTIRMHLLTEQSITSYVQGQFESPTISNTLSRWRSLYGTRLDDLQAAIISKAEGVFLWVTLVTTALVQDVVDHQPIETLERTLDLMRPEIEDLYTSIFYSIPERIRPNTVIMISLLLAALDEKDTSGLYFFLADESRGNPPRLDPSTINHARACTDIEKKILVRTRGIMNYNRKTDQVQFIHRTAFEWASAAPELQPRPIDAHLSFLRVVPPMELTRDCGYKYFPIMVHHASLVDIEPLGRTPFSFLLSSSYVFKYNNSPNKAFFCWLASACAPYIYNQLHTGHNPWLAKHIADRDSKIFLAILCGKSIDPNYRFANWHRLCETRPERLELFAKVLKSSARGLSLGPDLSTCFARARLELESQGQSQTEVQDYLGDFEGLTRKLLPQARKRRFLVKTVVRMIDYGLENLNDKTSK